ncbi:MAG: DUF4375 domain-containing protein [Candidatus Acidiferrum sp.]
MDKNKILIKLSESPMTKVWKEDFAKQSFPQKVFSAIWEVEAEVNNGGFSQYFFNNSRASAWFVALALEEIHAPKTANICERAIAAAFPSGLPNDLNSIRSSAGNFPKDILGKLSALDEEFYSYPHNLTDLLFAYVMLHPDEFGRLPELDGGSPSA